MHQAVAGWIAALVVSALGANHAETTYSVASRLALQNQLIEAQFEADLQASPETATSYGDYRFNSRLDDRSIEAAVAQNARDKSFVRRLLTISTFGFSEQDRLSHDLLLELLHQRIADFDLKTYEMPLTQMEGIQIDLADLPNAVPLDSLAHYRDYIARLRQIPRALEQTTRVLRQGERDSLIPPATILRKVVAEIRGTIAENPFLAPTKHYPASIAPADQSRLSHEITLVVASDVLPALTRFGDFIEGNYAPHGRASLGLSGLPDGAERYQNAIREETTTNLTPAEIEALGRKEIARITGLMTELARRQGFSSLAEYRVALANDATLRPASADQVLTDFKRYLAAMQPRLPEIFGSVPRAPLTVEEIPPSQPGNVTHYLPGTPDGSRSARIVVATSDLDHRSLLTDETVAYHEGVPGHHMQIAVEQQLVNLPMFRRHLILSAYAEGWAVYTEGVAKDMGFFKDPRSDYGRLQMELMRAVRLVVDPGIHAHGWTREQAVEFFRQTGAADEPSIQAEVDRYIAMPAQGLSYKIGQLKIRELRARAQAELGSAFDIRAFHDQVLNGGNLPLDMLETKILAWSQATATAKAGATALAQH